MSQSDGVVRNEVALHYQRPGAPPAWDLPSWDDGRSHDGKVLPWEKKLWVHFTDLELSWLRWLRQEVEQGRYRDDDGCNPCTRIEAVPVGHNESEPWAYRVPDKWHAPAASGS